MLLVNLGIPFQSFTSVRYLEKSCYLCCRKKQNVLFFTFALKKTCGLFVCRNTWLPIGSKKAKNLASVPNFDKNIKDIFGTLDFCV